MAQVPHPPPGVQPLFLRGVTCEKYGFKTGEGVMDLVDYIFLSKDEIMKEIQGLGVMSDFEPAKKAIESCTCEKGLLFAVDKSSKYGEVFLLCYTEASQEEYMKVIREAQEAIAAQLRAEEEAAEAKRLAEEARLNAVYEDKPIIPRPWTSQSASESEIEVNALTHSNMREPMAIEITRLKKSVKLKYKFTDRDPISTEFKPVKDPNFKSIRDSDIAIQAAPILTSAPSQTTWFRSVNKGCQYEAASLVNDDSDKLLQFLERVTVELESGIHSLTHSLIHLLTYLLALQQNESVDIFNEAFVVAGDEDAGVGSAADNELREIKNFADPTYSKSKALCAIDAVPKTSGMLAVSAVKNISFDQRIVTAGQTSLSYILVWDFRQLVKPVMLLQSQHEIFTFRFNKVTPALVAGGCMSGQVVLWDLTDAMALAAKRASKNLEDSGDAQAPLIPKYVSTVDHSHKKWVADLYWLPPTTQINYRGNLVGAEHLDGNSYQFVTIAGDGTVCVWDIRYEKIANDELRHIARPKHIPMEKVAGKDGHVLRPLWSPIYRAPLKRTEGVGELSLCKVASTINLKSNIANGTSLPGDNRSHLMITTEEGDVMFADICASAKESGHANEEEDAKEEDVGRDYVKWLCKDHPRPAVGLQLSPFFPDILLSVGDWSFHLWRVGESKQLFSSPLTHTYITAGCWSPTRPAVVLLACADGHILVWDFTDSSFRASSELKATHSKITSMEFLPSSGTSNRQQLLAVGDETGTLHVYEVPRPLARPVHKEESIMSAFLDREYTRLNYLKDNFVHDPANASIVEDNSRAATAFDAPPVAEPITLEMQQKAQHEALKKEEDDFFKLELAFINELGLSKEQLPAFIKDKIPEEKAEAKK